jgi:hypothetical protein
LASSKASNHSGRLVEEVHVFGSQVLEVIIGLILIYLVLSIGCSGIKELIASLFSLRATTLEAGIRNMLKNGGADYTSQIFNHPLVSASAPDGKKPSYIAARSFALALFDVLAPATPEQPRTIDTLRTAISQMPDQKLRSTLLSFVDTAHGDLDVARSKVEHWFDDTMERVSGWYKRTAQIIIFVAGLVLCAVLNADTLMVVKELWSDHALASAVVANAEKRVQQGMPGDASEPAAKLAAVAAQVREANTPPVGWVRGRDDIRSWPKEWWLILFKIFGILLTSFAITLGAPFWFDLLNKVFNMNARLSGDPPATAK